MHGNHLYLTAFLNESPIPELLNSFKNDDLDGTTLAQIMAGLHQLFALAIRQPTKTFKAEDFKRDLEGMGFGSDNVNLLTEALKQKSGRAKLMAIFSMKQTLPTIQRLHWRVDILISSANQPKLLSPMVTLVFNFSDGTDATVQCDIKAFHKLRLGVAQMLHEMQQLEKRPVLNPFINAI